MLAGRLQQDLLTNTEPLRPDGFWSGSQRIAARWRRANPCHRKGVQRGGITLTVNFVIIGEFPPRADGFLG